MSDIKIVNKLSVLGKSIPRSQLPAEMLDKTFLWDEISLQNRVWFSEAMQVSAMGNSYKRQTA